MAVMVLVWMEMRLGLVLRRRKAIKERERSGLCSGWRRREQRRAALLAEEGDSVEGDEMEEEEPEAEPEQTQEQGRDSGGRMDDGAEEDPCNVAHEALGFVVKHKITKDGQREVLKLLAATGKEGNLHLPQSRCLSTISARMDGVCFAMQRRRAVATGRWLATRRRSEGSKGWKG
jgi:hypothetical protein